MVFSILSNSEKFISQKPRIDLTTNRFQSVRDNTKNEIDSILIKNNYNYTRSDFNILNNRKPLIIHCCHHKTGTVVVEKILRAVCNKLGLKYQYCNQSQLDPNTDVWLEHHSKIDFNLIDRPIVGTHMIRNPYALIVSAYEYHKTTIEPWANRKIKKFNGVTYREILNRLSPEEGIIFEIRNDLYLESSKNTIMDIYNWDYLRPNFLELKFEDLMTNYDGTLANMFKHYGFSREMIEEALNIAKPYNLRNKNEDELKRNKHVTNKSLDLDKWRDYYNEEVIKKFSRTYPSDLFTKIGYIDCFPMNENIQNVNETDETEKLASIIGKDVKITGNIIENDEKDKLWTLYNGGNPFMLD